MRNLFLTSSGLNEKTAALFWECIGKEPVNAKAILVPSAAVGNDGAREGILVCIERLANMGIPLHNILLYDLAYLLSDGYKRTYSSYIDDIPVPFRLMTAQELTQYDMIVFCGGNARTLLSEINRTGFAKPLKQAVENGLVYLGISAGSMVKASCREWTSVSGNQRRQYGCRREFLRWVGIFGKSVDTARRKRKPLWRNTKKRFNRTG